LPVRAENERDWHPNPDELLDYHVGDVSSEQRERIQDHLVLCPECVQSLLDLDAFPDLPVDPREKLSPGEIASEWERFQGEVRQSRASGARGILGSAAGSFKLAAALAAICLGLGLQVLRMERQMGNLSRPRGGLGIVDLSPIEGRIERAEGDAKGIQVSPETDRLVLILNLADADSSAGYEVAILAADGHEIWRGGGLQRTPEGTLALEVPRRFLTATSYRIQLFRVDSRERKSVAEYSLRLR
jgi:hypothetical protein